MQGPRETGAAPDPATSVVAGPPAGQAMPPLAPGEGGVTERRSPAPASPSALDARAVEMLSHELRSPITTIHLGTKVLRSDVGEPVREAVLEAVDVEAFRLLR